MPVKDKRIMIQVSPENNINFEHTHWHAQTHSPSIDSKTNKTERRGGRVGWGEIHPCTTEAPSPSSSSTSTHTGFHKFNIFQHNEACHWYWLQKKIIHCTKEKQLGRVGSSKRFSSLLLLSVSCCCFQNRAITIRLYQVESTSNQVS